MQIESSIVHPSSSIRQLTKPRALPERAHIAVLAPAGPSILDNIREGARVLERRGHRVTFAENIDRRHRGYLAGSDEERADILNRFLRSPEYDAFFFARGGYGAMRILDRIDYGAIRDNPRPIVGFSDITALNCAILVKTKLVSFSGAIDWVQIDLGDDHNDHFVSPEERLRVAMARQ